MKNELFDPVTMLLMTLVYKICSNLKFIGCHIVATCTCTSITIIFLDLTTSTDLCLSGGFGGPNCWALNRGENSSNKQDTTTSVLIMDNSSAYRTMEQIIMVGLLLANSSTGPNANLCFVNALLQLLRVIPNFR